MEVYWSLILLFLVNCCLGNHSKLCEECMSSKKRKCCENLNSTIDGNRELSRRFVDPTFRGYVKTKSEFWMETFHTNATNFQQYKSLTSLLNKIAVEYLQLCTPYILYDSFVEKSEYLMLQTLFQTFPSSFFHGQIDDNYKLTNEKLTCKPINNCKSYILFLSDPQKTGAIIGPQMESKVVVVARYSQWKLQAFLSSMESSNIVNLLVIGGSLTAYSTQERPYVLYTHHLYADGLGSNVPVVLTTWIKESLSRPHVNLFPTKFVGGFAGHRFLIAAADQPPFIFRRKYLDSSGNINIFWEGVEYRLLKLLGQRLNFSFEIIEPRNTIELGSGEAVRKEVELGRVDMGMSGTYITVKHIQEIDMSVGHSRDCAAFITLASKALPKYRAIMGPFQWPVWLALTAVYLLAIFPLAVTDQLSLKYLIGNFGEIENMFWYVFGTFTNSLQFKGKYSWSTSAKNSTRIIIGFYWVFTIIITACYTGSIIAFVTLPAFPDTVDSVYSLLGLFFRVSTLDRGGWESWFANSSHEATERLYRKMEFVSSVDEGIGNVTQSFFWNYAFLGSKAQLEYLVQANFSSETMGKRSALHLSNECFAPFQVAIAFPKNSVYTRKINECIMRMHQSGLISKLFKEVSWQMQRTSKGKLLQANSGAKLQELVQEERQLTTADTEGMFLLMSLGYFIAAIILISEIIGGFTNKCRQLMKRTRRLSNVSSNVGMSETGSGEENQKNNWNILQSSNENLQNTKKCSSLSDSHLSKETIWGLYETLYHE